MAKKLSVFLLIISFIFIIVGCNSSSIKMKVFKKEGIYEVGVDFKEGDYILIAKRNSGYYLIGNSKGAIEDKNDGTSFIKSRYITLTSGKWIKFVDAYLCKIETVDFGELTKAGFSPGNYMAGKDIPAGEYVIENQGLENCFIIVNTTPFGTPIYHDKFFDSFKYRKFIVLEENEYIYFDKGILYNIEDAPVILKDSDNGIAGERQLKVGHDTEPGTYVIINNDNSNNYISYFKLKKNCMDRYDNEFSTTFYHRQYVELVEGDYIEFAGKLYKENEVPSLLGDTDNGITQGMYKVGTDIEEGTYVVINKKELFNSYFKIYNNCMDKNSETIIAFKTRQYVELVTGQYIVFEGKLYKESFAPLERDSDNGILYGQLKVGIDIEPGLYLLVNNSPQNGNYSLLNDSMDDTFETYKYRQYVELVDGQFIDFTGKLYSLPDAPEIIKINNTKYKPGQYLVGTDILPGTYELSNGNDSYNSYTITLKPYAAIGTPEYISNHFGVSTTTVNLTNGQYFKLSSGEMIKK